MWVNRNEIMQRGSAGDPALPPQRIDVTSTGGPVMWTALVEPSSATWLTLSRAAGETPSVLALTADPTGLSQGTHSADVVIKAEEFRVPGQTIHVTLVLAEEGSYRQAQVATAGDTVRSVLLPDLTFAARSIFPFA